MAFGGRYVLQFPTFTEFDYVMGVADRDGAISRSQVFYWMDYGKLKESPSVIPEYREVSVEASGKNRILDEVIVEPIPVTALGIIVKVGDAATVTNTMASSAVSSDASIASVTVVDKVVTITGVAAGIATITIKDSNNDTMTTVTVTVTAAS